MADNINNPGIETPQNPEAPKEQEAHKTPLEMVREGQDIQRKTLAQGQAMQAESHEVEEERVDTSPEVPGQGPPSTMRNFPQRKNQSHNQ